MLRRSTTSSVTCEHKNRLLVNTRIPCYPPAVSLWHGSLAIRWMLAVSPWEYSIAICSLPHRGKTPSPSAISPWEDSLSLRSLTITMGRVPTDRLPVGKLPHYSLVACCITVLSLCLSNETPREENCMGKLSSHCGRLTYIALSHFSTVRHSSGQHYPSLSRTGTVPLTGIAEAVASEASQVAYR
jgi:hypothetical protein